MEEAGFNIKEEFFRPDYNVIKDKSMSQQYMEYIEKKIQNDENILFALAGLATEDVTSLKTEGLIADISGAFAKYAPSYYQKTYLDRNFKYDISDTRFSDILYEEKKIYAVPLGKNYPFMQTMVLVRKEIAEAYGKDIKIDRIEDYENLLKWIDKKYEQYIPGLCPVDVNTPSYYTNDFYNVLGDFLDCTYVHDIIHEDMDEDTFYCSINRDFSTIRRNDKIHITPVTGHPDFKETMMKFITWRKDGTMDIFNYNNDIDLSKYATILSNTANYTMFRYMQQLDTFSKILDVGDYYGYLVNASGSSIHVGRIRDAYTYSSNFCLSGNEDGIASMLSFIEWLYLSQENYDLFMYGKEGADYKIKNGRFSLLENNNNIIYGNCIPYNLLENSDYMRTLDSYPANWDKVYEQVKKIGQVPTLSKYIHIEKGMPYENIPLGEGFVDNRKRNRKFLNDLFIEMKDNPEQILNDYISEKAQSQYINEVLANYQEYLAKLLSYLPE